MKETKKRSVFSKLSGLQLDILIFMITKIEEYLKDHLKDLTKHSNIIEHRQCFNEETNLL